MKNILIIEPDEVLAKTYKDYLTHHGYKVIGVKNAQEAIAEADKKIPDLVVLELQLIKHSGVEFLYEFRSYNDWQNIPVIVNSQVPKREFKDNWKVLSKELAVVEYLYKPTTS